jgi:putative hydroxymethylpyrimidine transport system substrate-binding protein
MKLIRLLLVGVAAVLLFVGCGESGDETAQGQRPVTNDQQGDLQKLQLSMEGYASPPDSGILLANRLGYFEEAGIAMTIYGAIRPEYAIGYAVEGASDVVVCPWPEVVKAQADGKPVVAVGSVLTEPTVAMIWLPDSGIETLADLKGKTIAIPGAPFQKDFLDYVLDSAGLTLADVKLKTVRFNSVQALADGRADAAFGTPWSTDGPKLESRGLEPVITKATELGIPPYEELALAMPRDSFARDPELYRRIVGVIARGAVAANEDPRAASEAVVDKTLELAPVKATEAGVEETAPMLSKTGDIDRAKLQRLVDWMYGQGMIRRKPPLSALVASDGQASGSKRSRK